MSVAKNKDLDLNRRKIIHGFLVGFHGYFVSILFSKVYLAQKTQSFKWLNMQKFLDGLI